MRVLDGRDPAAVREAAERLKDGDLVAFPTETVYGLGADALNPAAVRKIFEAKGRPADNPLIAHVADIEAARALVEWTDEADRLARAFWPGPLTLVLEKQPHVPDIVTAGGPTLAVRAPRHPVARALLAAFSGPIAAPSANRSTSISPTTVQHVVEELDGLVDLVLDGGPAEVGLESTVFDVAGQTVLRPGHVRPSDLRATLAAPPESGPVRSPGVKGKHYAPRRPARLFRPGALPDPARRPGHVVLSRGERPKVAGEHRRMPNDPAAFARELYEALRWADQTARETIWIEEVPDDELWLAIRDRLRRATG